MQRGLRDVVYNAANVCEPQFVTGRQCAWINNLVTLDLPANRARTAALQNLKNTCYVNHAFFQQRTFRIRDSLQKLSFRIAAFLFWCQFNSQLWSDQTRKFWLVVIFCGSAWPCTLDVMKFIGYFDTAKVQLYDLIRTIKAWCKKFS